MMGGRILGKYITLLQLIVGCGRNIGCGCLHAPHGGGETNLFEDDVGV
jgi:hypothetical protein